MKQTTLNRLYASLALAAAGCAGASVTQQSQREPVTYIRPRHPFAVDPDDVKLNSGIIASTYRSISGADESAEQLKIAKDTARSILRAGGCKFEDRRIRGLLSRSGICAYRG